MNNIIKDVENYQVDEDGKAAALFTIYADLQQMHFVAIPIIHMPVSATEYFQYGTLKGTGNFSFCKSVCEIFLAH